ncbi:MAG: RluA family pseudouridine synthase [Candidatus Dadabacteria bacterium]
MKIDDSIIQETKDFVAINKSPRLLSIPDREGKEISLKQMLKEKYGEIFTVHRLDKETSGLIVFALNEQMHKHLSQQFESRETKKIYNGFVLGNPAQSEGTINEPISEHPHKRGVMTVYKKGKESITEYKVLDSYRLYSWMEFRILTGRTHQIRVHMKHIGHPIVCDEVYGDGKPVYISSFKSRYKISKSDEEERPILHRLALHSSELSFSDLEGKTIHLQAPIPKDLSATLNQMNKYLKK